MILWIRRSDFLTSVRELAGEGVAPSWRQISCRRRAMPAAQAVPGGMMEPSFPGVGWGTLFYPRWGRSDPRILFGSGPFSSRAAEPLLAGGRPAGEGVGGRGGGRCMKSAGGLVVGGERGGAAFQSRLQGRRRSRTAKPETQPQRREK